MCIFTANVFINLQRNSIDWFACKGNTGLKLFNPFHATGFSLYPLKTSSENKSFSDVRKRYRKSPEARNWFRFQKNQDVADHTVIESLLSTNRKKISINTDFWQFFQKSKKLKQTDNKKTLKMLLNIHNFIFKKNHVISNFK